MAARIISGVPNMIVYAAGVGALYYFFIYETDEQKAQRIQRDATARQRGGYRRI